MFSHVKGERTYQIRHCFDDRYNNEAYIYRFTQDKKLKAIRYERLDLDLML